MDKEALLRDLNSLSLHSHLFEKKERKQIAKL